MTTHDPSSSSLSSHRSHLRLGCFSALAPLILLALAFGGYEYIAWHRDVDSYTYIAREAQGEVIAHEVFHDAKAASALRQAINANPNPVDSLISPTCGSPVYTGPVASYTLTFYSAGQVVETVTSNNPSCEQGYATCGGVTIWLDYLTPLDSGAAGKLSHLGGFNSLV